MHEKGNEQILDECQKEKINIQNIAQNVIDMSALLGHSSYEISLKFSKT
jgi:hypothetical protein